MSSLDKRVAGAGAMVPQGAPAAPPGGEEEEVSLTRQVHRMLRGRYLWVAGLGLLGLVGGAWTGYQLADEPTYQSEALVRIAPRLPRVLHSNEMNQVPPMFDDFVQAQRRLIGQSRVIELALQDTELREVARAEGLEDRLTEQAISRGLGTRQNGQLIAVRFEDESPAFAQAAATALVEAYDELYGGQDPQGHAERMQVLEGRRTSLRAEVRNLRDRIAEATEEQGVEAVQQRHRHRVSEMHRLETRLYELQFALSRAGAAEGAAEAEADAGGTGEREPEPDLEADELAETAGEPGPEELAEQMLAEEEYTAEQLGEYDPELQSMLRRRDDMEGNIAEMERLMGPEHRHVRRMRDTVEVLQERIDAYVDEHAERLVQRMMRSAETSMAGLGAEEIEQQIEQVEARYADVRQEVSELARLRLEVTRLQDEITAAEGQLGQIEDRIESLNMEGSIGGRIEVHRADLPGSPHRDPAQRQAVMGGFGGMSLGVGLVLLLGFLDKRCRTADDMRGGQRGAQLLGILPQLPNDLGGLDEANAAAHAVHHIRTLLQLGMERNAAQVVAVTSPGPGDGKTSLCQALGLSFGQSGGKTLLVDCDLAAGTLSSTATSAARRRIGRILQRSGLVDEAQLQEALAEAKRTGRRVGEILVANGHLSNAHLAEALDSQAEDALGLLDVARGEPLASCAVPTGADDLFLLPLGSAEARHAPELSPTTLRQILSEAKREFDVVLIDTGPMLRSLEASLVVAEADATVMVVSRGSQRPDMERAMEELERINATVAGMVFNRATDQDVSRYGVSGTRSGSASSQPVALTNGERRRHYGPMARALGIAAKNGEGNGHASGVEASESS